MSPQVALCEVGWRKSNWGGSCCAGLALRKPVPAHASWSRKPWPRSRAAPVPVRASTESASADPGPPRPGPRHILISTRPGLVREITAQPASTSLNPRDRRVTREHVCQGYVLAG